MITNIRKMWIHAAAGLLPVLLPAGAAMAQTPPFEEAKTLSTLVEPVERNFDIPQSAAGKYRITLTDLGALLPTPAELKSVQLVVTRGQTVVAKLDGTKDPASPTDTIDFDATSGSYVVHVVGEPGDVSGSGPVGVKIATVSATPTTVADFSATLASTTAVQEGLETYQIEFDVPADGDYDMTLADLAFPSAGGLDTATVYMFQPGATQVAACMNIGPTPVPTCPATQTKTLAAGHYQLVGGGTLAAGKDGALFSVYIKSVATGAVLHSRTVELGAVKRISDSSFLLDTGPYTLSFRDLMFPAGLLEASAIVTRAAQVTAFANGATPDKAFTVAADDTPYDVFAYAKADTAPPTGGDTAPGAGSISVEVKPASGPAALSYVAAMGAPSGSPTAYTFPVDIPGQGGAYRLKFGDFQFPASLGASRIAIIQKGEVAGKTDPGTSTSQTLEANLAAGPATVIVVVKPALNGGTTLTQTGGTFGIEMALASGGAANVLDVTQGVGGLVSVRKLSVTTAGNYDIVVKDLDAPEAFNDLMLVVSRGSTRLGTAVVSSGGSNPDGGTASLKDTEFSVGNYSITLIAQPGSTVKAATYALSISASPPAPTVTLTATPSSVASGATAGLQWSSTGATSCTASSNPANLWNGTKATSGTDSSAPLTVSTTFTLTCTDGNSRTTAKTVTVDVSAQNNNGGGGGGGGAFDWLTLVALTLAGALHLGTRRRPG